MTFDGHDLYPSLEAKAAAICFFIIKTIPLWTTTSAAAMPPWKLS